MPVSWDKVFKVLGPLPNRQRNNRRLLTICARFDLFCVGADSITLKWFNKVFYKLRYYSINLYNFRLSSCWPVMKTHTATSIMKNSFALSWADKRIQSHCWPTKFREIICTSLGWENLSKIINFYWCFGIEYRYLKVVDMEVLVNFQLTSS